MGAPILPRERYEPLRQKLLDRRRALFRGIEGVEADLSTLEESRETELEGRAQVEALERLLDRLEAHERRELQEIHSALARLAENRYGICERCGDPIAAERLEALPATRWCVECAADLERQPSEAVPGFEPPGARRPVPEEIRDLDDAELAEAVRQRLRAHEDPDLARVVVRCHRGRVRLSGTLPSEGQRQVLLRIVEDEMGLEAIDRLRISPIDRELPGETEPPAPPEDPPPEEKIPAGRGMHPLPLERRPAPEDEAEEPASAPDAPVPEER